MKITLLLSLAVVLASCSTPAPGPQTAQNKKPIAVPMDSPIIVSDGSTHLRHRGSVRDFQITTSGSNFEAIVNDSGGTVGKGECANVGTTCPSDFQNVLVAPWTLKVYDSNSNLVMTITPSKTSTSEVDAIINGTNVSNVYASGDNSGDSKDPNSAAVGGDISTPYNTNNFSFAKFTNGSSGSKEETITCASSPGCKLKIHYGF